MSSEENGALECPVTDNLPLITDADGDQVLVYAPGHIYCPLPVLSPSAGRDAGPGALEEGEKSFVRDLVRYLDPNFLDRAEVRQREPAPMIRDGIEYYLLRNLDRGESSIRLRMGDENWFYPDFVLWMLDKQKEPEEQTLCLIDPKGLQQGLRGGWRNAKFLSLVYKLRSIEAACLDAPVRRKGSEQKVRLRLRGALISTSSYEDLRENASEDFKVRDSAGSFRFPSRSEFQQARILFLDKEGAYVADLLEQLSAENNLDRIMREAAAGFRDHIAGRTPSSEVGCFLSWLLLKAGTEELEEPLGQIVELTLVDAARSAAKEWSNLAGECRRALSQYANRLKSGGIEDTGALPNPCRELLQRAFSLNSAWMETYNNK